MHTDPDRAPAPRGAAKGDAPRARPPRLQRINTTLVLLLLVAAMGFTVRSLSKKYAEEEVRIPGIYVKVRSPRGGTVEARAAPAPAHQTGGPTISLEVTLADVASLVGLLEEMSRTRVTLPCPVQQRVSLRARAAPVEAALEAVAAAANVTLLRRDAAYVLNACPPAAPQGSLPAGR